MATKKPNYADYFKTIKQCSGQWKTPEHTGIWVAWGPSEFFLDKTINAFKNLKAQTLGIPYSRHQGSDLDFDQFSNLWQQAGMFASSEIHLVDHTEKNKKLASLLEQIPSKNAIGNHILITYLGASIPAKISKQLSRLEAEFIPCFEPTKFELPKLTGDLCKKYKLKANQNTINFLIHCLGGDLFQLENEIKKLSLIFEGQDILNPDSVAEHLGFLKEDHAFQLSDLLIRDKASQAQCLINDLIDRGESGIAILGVLTKHIRNTLLIGHGFRSGQKIESIMKQTRLPNFVIKSYNNYVRNVNLDHIANALILCQGADQKFKTSKADEKLVLGEIIEAIAH